MGGEEIPPVHICPKVRVGDRSQTPEVPARREQADPGNGSKQDTEMGSITRKLPVYA